MPDNTTLTAAQIAERIAVGESEEYPEMEEYWETRPKDGEKVERIECPPQYKEIMDSVFAPYSLCTSWNHEWNFLCKALQNARLASEIQREFGSVEECVNSARRYNELVKQAKKHLNNPEYQGFSINYTPPKEQ